MERSKTHVSLAKRAAAAPGAIGPAAVVIMIASTIVFARLLLEIATVAPAFLPTAAPWLTVLLILSAISATTLWFRSDKNHEEMPDMLSGGFTGARLCALLVEGSARRSYVQLSSI